MKSFGVASLLAAASLVGQAVADVPYIEANGAKFFYSNNGTQFFIKGVAYQQDYSGNGTISSNATYVDPLASPDNCKRDIPYLLQLQTNTIRVYAINATADHSECMSMLQDAGIYVIADLSAPVYGQSIDRSQPLWDASLYARYTSVVDALQSYSNVIGFFAGNEVSNAPNNTDAAPFVKAAVRDTKAYIKTKGYRSSLGVGYASDDDPTIRVNIADFFNCGNQSEAIDFWGYNIYSWCGSDSNYEISGYADRTAQFANYSVPVFFAEYGCNQPEPRVFDEVLALYGRNMTPVWSGGIVYMYFQEVNNYGLVSIDSSGSVSTISPDFGNLMTKLSQVTPTGTNSASYTPSNSPQACPTEAAGQWDAMSSPLPYPPNEQLCSCMYDTLSCIVNSDTDSTAYEDLFNEVYGYMNGSIPGIQANGSTGQYGAYGMCDSTQQLGWAFNAYYQAQNSNSQACDFNGAASTQSPSTPSACGTLLQAAGPSGTGSVPPPSGTGAIGGSNSATSSGAAAYFGAPAILRPAAIGNLPLFAITALAAVSGIGMILL